MPKYMKESKNMSDKRYTISKEGTGDLNKQIVLRFMGKWVGSFKTKEEAEQAKTKHNEKRLGESLQEANKSTEKCPKCGENMSTGILNDFGGKKSKTVICYECGYKHATPIVKESNISKVLSILEGNWSQETEDKARKHLDSKYSTKINTCSKCRCNSKNQSECPDCGKKLDKK